MHLSDFHAGDRDDFLLDHLVVSFTATINWWVKNGMAASPQQTAGYFMEVAKTH